MSTPSRGVRSCRRRVFLSGRRWVGIRVFLLVGASSSAERANLLFHFSPHLLLYPQHKISDQKMAFRVQKCNLLAEATGLCASPIPDSSVWIGMQGVCRNCGIGAWSNRQEHPRRRFVVNDVVYHPPHVFLCPHISSPQTDAVVWSADVYCVGAVALEFHFFHERQSIHQHAKRTYSQRRLCVVGGKPLSPQNTSRSGGDRVGTVVLRSPRR